MGQSSTKGASVKGRRALLDATVVAIEEEGFGAVSLRSIARRASVSHAAPAHHFGDKAGLFTALAVEGFEILGADIDRALEATPSDDPAVRLVAIGVAYAQFADDHRARFEVMFRPELLRSEDPELLQASRAVFERLRGTVAEAESTGFGAGMDVDDITLLAWSTVHGFVDLAHSSVLTQLGFDVGGPAMTERLSRIITQATAALDTRP
jgi:AcrR family transcriptional regulator